MGPWQSVPANRTGGGADSRERRDQLSGVGEEGGFLALRHHLLPLTRGRLRGNIRLSAGEVRVAACVEGVVANLVVDGGVASDEVGQAGFFYLAQFGFAQRQLIPEAIAVAQDLELVLEQPLRIRRAACPGNDG
jgi:hypothetical protein